LYVSFHERADLLLVREVAVKAVGTQKKAIVCEQRNGHGVDLDVVFMADGSRDYILDLGCLGFLRSDHAVLELVVDQSVVLGKLGHLAVPRQIDPRISDLADDPYVAGEQKSRGRGAHTSVVGVEFAEAVDHVTGILYGPAEKSTELSYGVTPSGGTGRSEQLFFPLDPLPNEVDGLTARNLATCTSPDTITYDKKSEFRIGQKRVLVVRSLHTDVGMPEVTNTHSQNTNTRVGLC